MQRLILVCIVCQCPSQRFTDIPLYYRPSSLGQWQTVQSQIRRLIRVCTVCLNNWKLGVKWNCLISPFRTISYPIFWYNLPTSAVSTLNNTVKALYENEPLPEKTECLAQWRQKSDCAGKSACASAQSDHSLRCPHAERCILGYPKCV